MTDEERNAAYEKAQGEQRSWFEKCDADRSGRDRDNQLHYEAVSHKHLLERDQILAKLCDERADRMGREETAATILAALIQANGVVVVEAGTEGEQAIMQHAVRLTDALRAELSKKGEP